MTIELRAPGARAVFEPAYGGRLHQLFVEIDGHQEPLLVAPADTSAYDRDPLFGGCYPMAPWPNRIRDGAFTWRGQTVQLDNGREHALHGLVLGAPWKVVARAGAVLEMTCPLGPAWPWEGSCWQRFELGRGYLAMKLEVRSARERFPAGCGWHPWFRRHFAAADDVRIRANGSWRYDVADQVALGRLLRTQGDFLLDGSMLGDRLIDHCYRLEEPEATLGWPRVRRTIAIRTADPHLQLYTTPGALCPESQTCAPDAFNLAALGMPGTGFAVAEPGRPVALTSRWTWNALG